jgi:hypothetical protein
MLEEVIMKKHSLFKVILIVFGALVLINGGLAIAGQFVEKLNVLTRHIFNVNNEDDVLRIN